MNEQEARWFPAKKHGWGWGWPSAWQGWVVLLAYLVLLAGGMVVIDPRINAELLLAYVSLLSALLVAICWVKGERPNWRRRRGQR